MFIFFQTLGGFFENSSQLKKSHPPQVGSSLLFLMHWDEFQEESEPPSYNSWIKSMIKSYKNPWPPWEITYQLGWLVVGVKVHLFHDSTLQVTMEFHLRQEQNLQTYLIKKSNVFEHFERVTIGKTVWRNDEEFHDFQFPASSKRANFFKNVQEITKKNWRSASISPISFAALLGHSSYVREGAPIFQVIFLLNDTRVTVHLLTDKMEQSNSTWTCFRYATNTHSANGPWDKSLNCIFPSKHVIPESLKFSHWLSEKKNCKHAGKTFKNKKLQLQHKQLIGGLEISHASKYPHSTLFTNKTNIWKICQQSSK